MCIRDSAFLGRLRIDAKAESKAKGVYELAGGPFEHGLMGHLRFHDRHAYISVNGGVESLAEPDKLVPISRLVDDKETAVVAATMAGARLPKELTDQAYPVFEKLNAEVDRNAARGGGAPKSMPAFLKELLGWSRRVYDLAVADGDTLAARLIFDSKTGELDTEMVLQPKAKSALAADLAAFKPAKGRFHQLVTRDAVGGGWLCLPGPIPKGVRATGANFLEEAIPMIGKESALPVELGALFDAFGGIAQKAIAAGELDIGAALTGPTKDGHYTAVAALGLDDPTPLVKLVLAIGKDLPKEFAEAIKLNAYKIGDVAVHTLALEKLVPAELLKVLGDKAALNVAVGNKGLFLAVGPNAEAELKRAMALKPAETRAFDTLVNPAKAKTLAEAAGGDLGGFQAFALPDRPYSFYRADVIGGPTLKMRTSLVQYAVWMMLAFSGTR